MSQCHSRRDADSLGNGCAALRILQSAVEVRDAREHQRHSQRSLKMHFFLPRAARVVECENSPLRPAMTFGQKRHCEKYRRGSGGEADADFNIALLPEAPFKRTTDIVQRGKVKGPL